MRHDYSFICRSLHIVLSAFSDDAQCLVGGYAIYPTKTQGIGRHVVRYNICIPNAQYSSFSAQQNLWCEILEF